MSRWSDVALPGHLAVGSSRTMHSGRGWPPLLTRRSKRTNKRTAALQGKEKEILGAKGTCSFYVRMYACSVPGHPGLRTRTEYSVDMHMCTYIRMFVPRDLLSLSDLYFFPRQASHRSCLTKTADFGDAVTDNLCSVHGNSTYMARTEVTMDKDLRWPMPDSQRPHGAVGVARGCWDDFRTEKERWRETKKERKRKYCGGLEGRWMPPSDSCWPGHVLKLQHSSVAAERWSASTESLQVRSTTTGQPTGLGLELRMGGREMRLGSGVCSGGWSSARKMVPSSGPTGSLFWQGDRGGLWPWGMGAVPTWHCRLIMC